MKTISGKNISTNESINEGILSSTKSGRENLIADFCKAHFNQWNFQMNNDMSINIVIKSQYEFFDVPDIPVWIKESACDLYIRKCGITHFYLPSKGKKVIIEDCNKLEKIETKTASELDELIIRNCDNVDLSSLKELKVKKIRIFKCGITTMKGIECAERIINIRSCKKLRTYDLDNKNNCILVIENCPIKAFATPLSSPDVTLVNLKKTPKLDIKIGNVDDFRLEECSDIENMKVSGNNIQTVVISDCEALESVNVDIDCKTSLSFVKLPKIKTYEIKNQSGVCVFEEVASVPESIVCKKKLIR
jgi:hypothetical protein